MHANTNVAQFTKSKQYYIRFVDIKVKDVLPVSDYLAVHGENCFETDAFHCKIILEKEIKLKEFNFKVLHGILPCNRNLKNWRIKDSDLCDICQRTQTIQHLLYDCIYVKPIWDMVNRVFNTSVTFPMLLGSDNSFQYNRICTLLAFLIYKDWLLLSLEYKSRTFPMSFIKYKAELKLRKDIYSRCKYYSDQDLQLIDEIISNM